MHLRQLREICSGTSRDLSPPIPHLRMRPIEMEQDAVRRARIDRSLSPALNIAQRIMLRHACITEPIIGLRKIAQATLRIFPRLHLRQQHPQVTLSLSARQRRRIPRMNQLQVLRRYRFDRFYNDSSIPQFLMDTPHIAAPLRIFENTGSRCFEQYFLCILINTAQRYEKHLRSTFRRFLDNCTQRPRCRLCEILICIEEYNPISMDMRQRNIPCFRKIISPRELIECGMELRSDSGNKCISRRRYDNNLIRCCCNTRKRAAQFIRFVLHNIAGGDLHDAHPFI